MDVLEHHKPKRSREQFLADMASDSFFGEAGLLLVRESESDLVAELEAEGLIYNYFGCIYALTEKGSEIGCALAEMRFEVLGGVL